MNRVRPDRLRVLLDTVLEALDEGLDGRALAGRAYLSRFHFDRLVAAGLGEAPSAFRRRLLLERAGWQLTRTVGVTEAGFQAGYGSTQAFSRAFSRAYAMAPSRFARDGGDFRIAAPNGIHFHPPAGLLLPGDQGRGTMDLTDRLLEHDRWLTGRLLDHAAELPDEALDHQIRPGHEVLSFDGPEPTVRVMLDRLVWTKEVWTAAIGGRDVPDGSDRSITGLRSRLAAAGEEFLAMARRIRDGGRWDDVFVDAMCDPPQSFTFGGVIAHVITFSAYRRQVLLGALEELGSEGLATACPNDPIEWERLRAADRSHPPALLRGTAP
jgi:AraC family transcriptional regulator